MMERKETRRGLDCAASVRLSQPTHWWIYNHLAQAL